MPLTAIELDDIRGDVGDVSTAFTDAEIQRLYDRLSSAPNQSTRIEGVKGLMFERLLNQASKLHDYSAGAVDEKLSQIVKNLERRLDYYRPALEAARGQNRQFAVGKLGKRAHPYRVEPDENRIENGRQAGDHD